MSRSVPGSSLGPLAGALLGCALAWLVAAPAQAQMEHDPEEDTPPLVQPADPGADPDADPDSGSDEPDQEGGDPADPQYEPDQRGYEPDQRGYEPDQRGAEGDQEESEPPASGGAGMGGDAVRSVETVAGADYGSAGGELLGAEFALVLGLGGHAIDAIAHDNLVRLDQRGSIYGALGVRAGIRIGPVSLGATVDSALESSLTLTRIGGYVSTPLTFEGERFVPVLRLGFGYALASSLYEPLDAQRDALVDGLFVDLALGVRWTFSAPFTIGLEAVGSYTHLERGGVACTASCTAEALDVRTPGSADGLSLRLQLFGGVSF